jgi:hypothetical protein
MFENGSNLYTLNFTGEAVSFVAGNRGASTIWYRLLSQKFDTLQVSTLRVNQGELTADGGLLFWNGDVIETGAATTGPTGSPGDRFLTKTINPVTLNPTTGAIISLAVDKGLAYIVGNTVKVVDSIYPGSNFLGNVQFYSKSSGILILDEISSIEGLFGSPSRIYNVNLTV